MDAFPDEEFLADASRGERPILRCAAYPSRWKEFSDTYRLSWTIVPFRENGASAVPTGPGLYCFIVHNECAGLPAVFFPLYAGETLTLRQRYRNYLRERSNKRGRFTVRKFLNVFWDEAAFCYAEFDADKQKLRAIERDLNDSLAPPYSVRDFSAGMRARRSAWQK